MAKKDESLVFSQKRFLGLSDYPKEGSNGQIPNLFYWGRAVNFRDDPQSLTLLPASLKKSGSVVTDLIKWGERVPVTLTSFFYGDTGNLYQRTKGGTWSNIRTVSNSHGNGLAYFTGDDYLYYPTDNAIGRYGPTQNAPTFSDNFLKAQGGVPTNTNSVAMASSSSEYVSAADSVSLSITGDLTLETYFKCNSLPTVGNSMTLLGKWDESGATRSYKLDLFGVSGYFGDGSDGSLTISSNTTESPIDSACTGTSGTQSLAATNASFAVGQIILIHQSQGTNAGQWERNTIQGYSAGTITLNTPLIGTYTTGAQVRVLKRYTNVTINSGVTYTAKAWNGTTGGILAFLANGTVTVTGSISANGTDASLNNTHGGTGTFTFAGATGCGFSGGESVNSNNIASLQAYQGESASGIGTQNTSSNGTAGGGGFRNGGNANASGGAGGNGTSGANGTGDPQGGSCTPGSGGNTGGSADLTNIIMGGGGGGEINQADHTTANAASGAGIILISGATITVTGSITANGGNAYQAESSGGAGAGGSILMKAQIATFGSGLITANGGGTIGGYAGGHWGAPAGDGRIVLDYLTSYTGTTTPTLNAIQDSTLVTTTTIQARLGISNNGTAFEYLTQNLSSLTTSVWNRLSVSWEAATATATFYLNAFLLGTSTGTKTAISDNTSLLYIGANKGASVVQNFFDGLQDDIRIWSNVQTASQIFTNNQLQINPDSSGLQAYYKMNGDYTDATGNSNTGTNHSTTFSTDVPFPAATTRLDIDTQNTNTGDTYTLLTSISEGASDMMDFTPTLDPQASMAFYVNAAGTGNWTLTIHNKQNVVIATQTIAAAGVPSSGAIEFVFATPWRILAGQTYHAHLTVSTGTSSIVTGTANSMASAEYTTYYGFLVTETQFHPAIQFTYQPLGGVLTGAIIIGNERYLAVWDGANYSANYIAFPPAWHVRCFGFWREYLAIGMWRGGGISDFSQGRIYFWDGVSPTFNFFIDIPEGQINALFGADTDLYIIAGYRGYLLDYQGTFMQDTGNGRGIKLKRTPKIAPTDTIEVYPGAFTMWRSLLHIGYGANMSSSTIQQGVYSHGTFNQFYPDTMSYDYVISTGNTNSSVTIGCVYPLGDTLIVGWRDGIATGADEINFSNPPASSGEIQVLIQDDNAIWKQKNSFQVRADFLALRSGESIDCEIAIDRGAFTLSSPDAKVGDVFTKLNIAGGRGYEYQIGAHLYATGTTSPTLKGISLRKDPLPEEDQF